MSLGLGLSLGLSGRPLGGFSPLSLSPSLWLDASDESTITHTSGKVTQWDDKSGNGYHVANNTGSREPITGTTTMNGLNTITNNATVNSYLQVADFDMTAVTFFAVLQNERTYPEASSVVDVLFRHDSTPSPLVSSFNGFVGSGDDPAIHQEYLDGDLYIGGIPKVNDDTFSPDTSVIFTVRSSSPLLNNTLNVLGRDSAGFPWSHTGRVGEMIWFDRELTDAEINQVGAYLTNKWLAPWTPIPTAAPEARAAGTSSGGTSAGDTQTVDPDSFDFTQNPTGYTYQWERDPLGDGNWEVIAGAVAIAYIIAAAITDPIGSKLRCGVIPINAFGSGAKVYTVSITVTL